MSCAAQTAVASGSACGKALASAFVTGFTISRLVGELNAPIRKREAMIGGRTLRAAARESRERQNSRKAWLRRVRGHRIDMRSWADQIVVTGFGAMMARSRLARTCTARQPMDSLISDRSSIHVHVYEF